MCRCFKKSSKAQAMTSIAGSRAINMMMMMMNTMITESGASVPQEDRRSVASSTDMERVDIEKHLACGALSQGLAKGRQLTWSSATVVQLPPIIGSVGQRLRPVRVKEDGVHEVASPGWGLYCSRRVGWCSQGSRDSPGQGQ